MNLRAFFSILLALAVITLSAPAAHADSGLLDTLGNFIRSKLWRSSIIGTEIEACFRDDYYEPLDPKVKTAAVLADYKTADQVDRYIECYLDAPEYLNAYRSKYSRWIDLAANNFGLPKTFLKCLYFRESQFNAHAESDSRALGLAQLLPTEPKIPAGTTKAEIEEIRRKHVDTPKYISILIGHRRMSAQDVKKYEADVAGINELDVAKLKPEERKKYYAARQKLNWRAMGLSYQRYIEQVSSESPKAVARGTVPLVNAKTALDPVVAIGAGTLYSRDILNQLKAFQPALDTNPVSRELSLVVAGLYNRGPGFIKKVLTPVKDKTLSSWIEALRKSDPEARGHIDAIANCSESPTITNNPWKPPTEGKNTQRDCTPEQSAKDSKPKKGEAVKSAKQKKPPEES